MNDAVAVLAQLDAENLTIEEQQAVYHFARTCAVHHLKRSDALCTPQEVRMHLDSLMFPLEHEVFGVIWLDNQNRSIGYDESFRGTIDAASVYPREVVKAALKENAAGVILVHNHPSGNAEPSSADRAITERLKEALSLVDIRVLDHFVVGDIHHVSFAQRGWI